MSETEPTPSAAESQQKASVRPGIAAVGAVLSVSYLGALLAYAVIQRGPFLKMLPNEFADFLGGAFAPLAFLWLVLGFIQQGQELRISSDALRLQGDELRNSVEQQRQLVEVSRQQLESEAEERRRADREADLAAAPRLHFTTGGTYAGPHRKITFTLKGGGPTCSDVEINFADFPTKKVPILPEGRDIAWVREYNDPSGLEPFSAEIRYTDVRGNRRLQKFYFPVDPAGGPHKNGAFTEPVRTA